MTCKEIFKNPKQQLACRKRYRSVSPSFSPFLSPGGFDHSWSSGRLSDELKFLSNAPVFPPCQSAEGAKELHGVGRTVIKSNTSEDLPAHCQINTCIYFYINEGSDLMYSGKGPEKRLTHLFLRIYYLKRRHPKAECHMQLNFKLRTGHHKMDCGHLQTHVAISLQLDMLRLGLLNYCFNMCKTVEIPF